MEQGIKVAIDAKSYGGVDVYIIRKEMSKLFAAQPVELVFEEAAKEQGESFEPTLRLSEWFAHDLFQALAEALDEKGIKTDKDAKIEGTLEATRYHLEDLRALLKLDDTSSAKP